MERLDEFVTELIGVIGVGFGAAVYLTAAVFGEIASRLG